MILPVPKLSRLLRAAPAMLLFAGWSGDPPAEAKTVNKTNVATNAAANAKSQDRRDIPPGSGLELTAADAVFLGVRKNNAIRSAFIDRVSQRYDLWVAENRFAPRGSLEASATHEVAAGSASDALSIGPTVTTLTPIGTVFTFSWDNNAARSSSIHSLATTGSFDIVQPLLRGAGTEVNLAPVRSARLTEDINQLRLRATVSQTVTDILIAFRELARSREFEKLAEDAVNRAQSLIDIDQNLIQAGRMARMEVVQAQADLETQRLAVLQSRSQMEAARLSLAVLLNLDLGTVISASDTPVTQQPSIDLQTAMRIALARRPDYLVQEDIVEQSRLGIAVAENERLWDISLVGHGRLGREYEFAPGVRATKSDVKEGSVGINLSVPINDLTVDQDGLHAGASLQDAELQLATIRQGLEQQIRSSITDIGLRWQQVDVSKRAEDLARIAVENERLKLNAGRSTTFQVQTLEASYRAAEVQRLNAETDYANALSTFDLELGTTLDTWKISLRGQ